MHLAVPDTAVPRYLLPAARTAYDIKAVASDRLYEELRPFLEDGRAMPNNIDIFERRRAAKAALDAALK